MFQRKDLEILTYHDLKKLAQTLNGGGYSIVICKDKETLINNILNTFVVQSEIR